MARDKFVDYADKTPAQLRKMLTAAMQRNRDLSNRASSMSSNVDLAAARKVAADDLMLLIDRERQESKNDHAAWSRERADLMDRIRDLEAARLKQVNERPAPAQVVSAMTANDPITPNHYKLGKVEVIDAIEAWQLGFCLGNTVKYVARAGRKDPAKTIEDLRKGRWYLDREIARLERAMKESK